MYSLILEGEGGPSEDRENSLIFFFFLLNPSLRGEKKGRWENVILFSVLSGYFN